MKLKVNGEDKDFDEELTVAGLLARLDIPPRGIAVELNREIVPRGRHSETSLKEGDKVEIVRMVGGG